MSEFRNYPLFVFFTSFSIFCVLIYMLKYGKILHKISRGRLTIFGGAELSWTGILLSFRLLAVLRKPAACMEMLRWIISALLKCIIIRVFSSGNRGSIKDRCQCLLNSSAI